MPDSTTTLQDLKQLVETFVAEREWSQFHAPKNLAMAIAIEAAELMEHFQWISPEVSCTIADHPEKLSEVAEELSDVFAYCLAMASELNIDIATSVRAKMVKNALKYPAEEFRGKFSRDQDANILESPNESKDSKA